MKTCAHCGNQFDIGGSLYLDGVDYPVCHPDEGQDCYRLVTVYGEPVGSRMPFIPKQWADALGTVEDLEERIREKFAALKDGENSFVIELPTVNKGS